MSDNTRPKKPAAGAKPKRAGRRGNNVSLAPLSPDDAMRAVLNISPADAKRINESRPGGK